MASIDVPLTDWEARSLAGKLSSTGFPWLPLKCPTDGAPDDAKVPAAEWRTKGLAKVDLVFDVKYQWQKQATNVGIMCTGLRVIDVDVDEEELCQELETLALAMLGPAPKRYRANSPRFALLYRAQSGEPEKISIGDAGASVEVLGKGQFLLAAGLHPTFSKLHWSRPLGSFTRDELVSVSEPRLAAFREKAVILLRTGGTKAARAVPEAVTAPFLLTERHIAFANAALKDEVTRLRAMSSGRNRGLNNAAFALGTIGWLDGETATRALWQAAQDNGYRTKDGDEEARKTLLSGFEAGRSKPRGLPEELEFGCSITHIDGKPFKAAATGSWQAPPVVAAASSKVIVTRGRDIHAQAVHWLWRGFLALGKYHLLAGPGGAGKGTIACSLAAAVTNGGRWPDASHCLLPGNVIFWSSEDGKADTLKPRLIAAGANEDRYGFVTGATDEKGNARPFDPSRDMQELRNAIADIRDVRLLIIDPIVEAVDGDMHRANDVRRSLTPLVELAEELNLAVLGITHFSKNTHGRETTERVLGSQAFAALARLVMGVTLKEGTNAGVLTRTKSNVGKTGDGFEYSIQECRLSQDIQTTNILWGQARKGSAREILAGYETETTPQGPSSKLDTAIQFVTDRLSDGPMLEREMTELAKELGHSEATLKRAKAALHVVSSRRGFQGPLELTLPSKQ